MKPFEEFAARKRREADAARINGKQPLALRPIVTKRSTDPGAPFVFEHLMLSTSSRSGPTRRP